MLWLFSTVNNTVAVLISNISYSLSPTYLGCLWSTSHLKASVSEMNDVHSLHILTVLVGADVVHCIKVMLLSHTFHHGIMFSFFAFPLCISL